MLFILGVSFHFVPLTGKVSILSPLLPIWPLDRIPDFHLGSVWGQNFHLGSACFDNVAYLSRNDALFPLCTPTVSSQRCSWRLGGTHCESVLVSGLFRYGNSTYGTGYNQAKIRDSRFLTSG
eukprot:COSAG01_NODE_1647_length_9631_cov_82.855644_6_plen_122_part_00